MQISLIPLVIFMAAYVMIAVKESYKAWVALAAGAVLLLLYGLGTLAPPVMADGVEFSLLGFVGRTVAWNVLGLMLGMMVISHIFEASRIPAVVAEQIVGCTGSARLAFFWIAALTGFFSIFLCNVSCVLLVAPVALSLTRRLKISPVRPLIFLAIASNIQGVATLIGDPPSMLMAGHMHLTFNDFFFYQAKPGIFWAIQVGSVAAGVVIFFMLRKFRNHIEPEGGEGARSWVPAWLIGVLVVILALSSSIDREFRWLAGSASLVVAAVALVWYLRVGWGSLREVVRAVDWQTLIFLVGMFIMVQALDDAGWLKRVAGSITALSQGSLLTAFCVVIVFSVVVSAVVDNVPFLIAMLPVADTVARSFSETGGGEKLPLIMFGMLAATCLGGNITPIGASANIVAVGILRKEGEEVSFLEFVKLGLPLTVAALVGGCWFIWWVWA